MIPNRRTAALALSLLLPAFLAYAPPTQAQQTKSNTSTSAQRDKVRALPAPAGRQQIFLTCSLERPDQIHRFYLECQGSTEVDVAVADCCLQGDHWQVKVKEWDSAPNTAVAIAPGPDSLFSAPARVFGYGAKLMRVLVECSYLHGINAFGADAFLTVVSDGACTSQDLGKSDLIDRTP